MKWNQFLFLGLSKQGIRELTRFRGHVPQRVDKVGQGEGKKKAELFLVCPIWVTQLKENMC